MTQIWMLISQEDQKQFQKSNQHKFFILFDLFSVQLLPINTSIKNMNTNYTYQAICSIIIGSSFTLVTYCVFLSPQRQYIQPQNSLRLYLYLIIHLFVQLMIIVNTFLQQKISVINWLFALGAFNTVIFTLGQIIGGVSNNAEFLNAKTTQQGQNYQLELFLVIMYFQIVIVSFFALVLSSLAKFLVFYHQKRKEEKVDNVMNQFNSQDYVDEQTPYNTERLPDQAQQFQKQICPICLDNLSNQRVIKLTCRHYFHKTCYRKWLASSKVCPMCRQVVIRQQQTNQNNPEIQQRIRIPGPTLQTNRFSRNNAVFLTERMHMMRISNI